MAAVPRLSQASQRDATAPDEPFMWMMMRRMVQGPRRLGSKAQKRCGTASSALLAAFFCSLLLKGEPPPHVFIKTSP